LFGQLFALGAIFLRFASDAIYKVGGYRSDSDRRKDIVKWRDKLRFDDFNSDVVNKTF
jgi:hypothetical protein